jgi:hypothetical protein
MLIRTRLTYEESTATAMMKLVNGMIATNDMTAATTSLSKLEEQLVPPGWAGLESCY